MQWDLAAFCACTALLLAMNATAVYEMDRRANVEVYPFYDHLRAFFEVVTNSQRYETPCTPPCTPSALVLAARPVRTAVGGLTCPVLVASCEHCRWWLLFAPRATAAAT